MTLLISFILLLLTGHVLSWWLSRPSRSLAKAQMLRAGSPGASVRYYVAGDDTARTRIIFVDGTPATAVIWREQFKNPFPNAQMIAVDRPGFGGSTPALIRPSLQLQVEALLPLLTNAPRQKLILVGHSYGGAVVLLAALEHPELVAAVLLVGGSVDPTQEQPLFVQKIAAWRVVSCWLPGFLRQCNRELLALKDDLIAMQKRLPELRVPVVMLHGDRDRQVPVENVAWLETRLAEAGKPGLFHKMIQPGFTHFIPWEHPQAVAAAVRALPEQ